ncbi:MAG: SagB/ThcOx family dehydrogenase, partial [Candidatus Bathyarchaeia archaeon]
QYATEPITLENLAQLLWAAQGITAPEKWVGLRTAPSAGGLYPLEVYVVVKPTGVVGLDAGVYHYNPQTHSLTAKTYGDLSGELMAAAVNQEWVGNAAANIVLTAIFDRTTIKYGDRGAQYVWQESGHIDQNIYLQATTLGLATTVIGAFFEGEVQRILGIPAEEKPVYIATVGVPSE